MFTENLANLRMILLVYSVFDVVSINEFVGFADGRFPSVTIMFLITSMSRVDLLSLL